MFGGPDNDDLDRFSDLEIIARTIFGEARGEHYEGQQAVCSVIFNRVKKPRWWGHDARSVCLHPFQFSSWNEGDPNRAILIALKDDEPIYGQCLSIAAAGIAGTLLDLTNDADSYRRIGTPARWAEGLTPVANIGHHEFFVTI